MLCEHTCTVMGHEYLEKLSATDGLHADLEPYLLAVKYRPVFHLTDFAGAVSQTVINQRPTVHHEI